MLGSLVRPMAHSLAHRLTALAGALAGSVLGLCIGAAQPASAETVLDRVSRTNRINLVVMDGDLPYSTKQGNGYAGLAVEFATEIQKELSDYTGKPVQLVSQPVDSLEQGFAGIASGVVDLACGVGFSWGRSMFVDYSLPFALSGTRLITPAGNDGTPASLQGKTVGVVKNSLSAEAIAKLMQAYINDDPKAQSRINQWVGPGSSVNLSQDAIKTYFANVLLTSALLQLS